MGSIMHLMLKDYYSARAEGKPWADCVSLGHAAGLKATDEEFAAVDPDNVKTCLDTYLQYTEFYRGEKFIVKGVEEPFAKVIYQDESLRVIYAGIIDLRIEDEGHDKAVDHKTESRKSDPQDLNNQFMGYCNAIDYSWFLVNKISFAKTVKPVDRFRRYPIRYERARLDEWLQNTLLIVDEFLRREAADSYPMNFTSCDKYSGCSFRDFCRAIPAARHVVLHSGYVVGKEWDPLRSLREDKL
jgi:hypothetical protein